VITEIAIRDNGQHIVFYRQQPKSHMYYYRPTPASLDRFMRAVNQLLVWGWRANFHSTDYSGGKRFEYTLWIHRPAPMPDTP